MGYRKITVDGVEYQYVVGKTHVKVRGMQAVPAEHIGELFDNLCPCCGEPEYELYNAKRENHQRVRVHPSNVADFIRKETRHLVSG